MSLGLGKIVGLGLLSQFMGGGKGLLGNQEEDKIQSMGEYNQPPTQATNNTNQGFGGFGGIVSGVSNQMFQGMSPEQVARLGIGFNSMRLDPDPNIAKSFQNTIDTATQKTNRNATVVALRKMGKNNLANLVESNALDVGTAMQLAFKEGKGDSNATVAFLKSKEAEYPVFADLAAMLMANPNMATKINELALKEMGIGEGETDLVVSPVYTNSESGQQYQYVTNKQDGSSEIVMLEGTQLTPSQEFDLEQDKARTARDQDAAVNASNDAFKQGEKALRDVANYRAILDQAVSESGEYKDEALTGFINSKLPALTTEQAIINSLRNVMGIDVINMATFGALSEREMKMAMATNIDTNLKGQAFIDMAYEQMYARQKLANELLSKARELERVGSYSQYKESVAKLQEMDFNSSWNEIGTQIGAPSVVIRTSGGLTETLTGQLAWERFNLDQRMRYIAADDNITKEKYITMFGDDEQAQMIWTRTRGQ